MLGSYVTLKEAQNSMRLWRQAGSLATERYYQKSVRVFSGGPQVFYVSYTTTMPRAEAIKLYKLLRINDPKVTPQVIQLRGAS